MSIQHAQVSRAIVLLTLACSAGCNASAHAPSSGPLPSINPTSSCTTSLESCSGGGGGDSYGLSGRTLNGTSLDGNNLAGHGLVGVSLEGANGQTGRRGRISLDGSQLSLAGGSVVGATLEGQLDTGRPLPLRVESSSVGVGPDDLDIIYYVVSYQTASGFLPLCGIGSGGAPVPAIALAGRWNYSAGRSGGGSHIDDESQFTWACDGYALAKCAELGYKPWDTAPECDRWGCHDVSLAPTHQACTRAIRADYCGNGVSYTLDGTLIDIYDPFGLRTPTAGWSFEAEWTQSGARCATREREPSLGKPACWSDLQRSSCGSERDFSGSVLLMTQDSPQNR